MPSSWPYLMLYRNPHFLCPQNTIIKTTLLQFHSNSHLFHVPQPIPPKPTNHLSVEIDHATVIKNGSIRQLHVSNHFLNLYVRSTNLKLAHQLFDEMPERDVRSWTILISGFSRNGSHKFALGLFGRMQKEMVIPNQFTFSAVFKCCAAANELNFGKTVLGWILRNGVCFDTTLQNSVLDFYLKCEAFDYARKFFESMSVKDTVSWNIMIGAYIKNRDMEKAEGFFRRLPAKNAESWNTVIDGYLQNGRPQNALHLLHEMVTKGPSFTHVTFSIALILASSLHHGELGKQIHGRLTRIGIHDPFIKNSLLNMYCKCGEIDKASIVFETDRSRGESVANSVSLSSMINGYIRNDKIEDGLKVFRFMLDTLGGIDDFTLATVLSACADSGLLELGQLIHTYILKTGHQPDVFISSSMIKMYAKCGSLQSSWSIFKESKTRNIVLYTSAICNFASHGEGKETIRLFELMRAEGIKPNEVTFIGVLTACSHAGLVTEGCNYFVLMRDVYGIEPTVEHYTCVVDLLGRAGRLNEIRSFISENKIWDLSAVWKAFLFSCYLHKDLEMGRWVCEKLYELEPLAAGPYVLMSKSFASDFRWEEAAMLKDVMQERGIKKQPGQSWIN